MEDVRRAIAIIDFIRGQDVVPAAVLKDWARSQDPDVLGAAYVAATEHADRIQGVTLNMVGILALGVFSAGLKKKSLTDYGFEPPDSHIVMLRFLIECLHHASTDDQAQRELRKAQAAIRDLYKAANGIGKQRIVDGLLEHAFECPTLRHEFDSWRRDPILRQAYDKAYEWARSVGVEGPLVIGQQAGALPKCCPAAPHTAEVRR